MKIDYLKMLKEKEAIIQKFTTIMRAKIGISRCMKYPRLASFRREE